MTFEDKYLKYKIKYQELQHRIKGGAMAMPMTVRTKPLYYEKQGSIYIKMELIDPMLIERLNEREIAIKDYVEDRRNLFHITLFDIKLNMNSDTMSLVRKLRINDEITRIIDRHLTRIVLSYVQGKEGYSILGENPFFFTKIFKLDPSILINIFNDIMFFLANKSWYRLEINDDLIKLICKNKMGGDEEVACFKKWNDYRLEGNNMVHISIGKIKTEKFHPSITKDSMKAILFDIILKKYFPPLIASNYYILDRILYQIKSSINIPSR